MSVNFDCHNLLVPSNQQNCVHDKKYGPDLNVAHLIINGTILYCVLLRFLGFIDTKK